MATSTTILCSEVGLVATFSPFGTRHIEGCNSIFHGLLEESVDVKGGGLALNLSTVRCSFPNAAESRFLVQWLFLFSAEIDK